MANGEAPKLETERLTSIQKAVEDGNKKIIELNKTSFEIRTYFEEKNKQLEDKLKRLEESAENNKMRLIEALGIFVALFTFISVNVQIFNKLTSVRPAIGFMLAMGGITIVILLVIEVIIRTHTDKRVPYWHLIILFLIALIQIIIGIVFTRDLQIAQENTNNTIKIDANIKTEQDISKNTEIKEIKQ